MKNYVKLGDKLVELKRDETEFKHLCYDVENIVFHHSGAYEVVINNETIFKSNEDSLQQLIRFIGNNLDKILDEIKPFKQDLRIGFKREFLIKLLDKIDDVLKERFRFEVYQSIKRQVYFDKILANKLVNINDVIKYVILQLNTKLIVDSVNTGSPFTIEHYFCAGKIFDFKVVFYDKYSLHYVKDKQISKTIYISEREREKFINEVLIDTNYNNRLF